MYCVHFLSVGYAAMWLSVSAWPHSYCFEKCFGVNIPCAYVSLCPCYGYFESDVLYGTSSVTKAYKDKTKVVRIIEYLLSSLINVLKTLHKWFPVE